MFTAIHFYMLLDKVSTCSYIVTYATIYITFYAHRYFFNKVLLCKYTCIGLCYLLFLLENILQNASAYLIFFHKAIAKFKVKNVVTQVGILSPILFSVYVDGLFE